MGRKAADILFGISDEPILLKSFENSHSVFCHSVSLNQSTDSKTATVTPTFHQTFFMYFFFGLGPGKVFR